MDRERERERERERKKAQNTRAHTKGGLVAERRNQEFIVRTRADFSPSDTVSISGDGCKYICTKGMYNDARRNKAIKQWKQECQQVYIK
jgi:hypothetical protein